MNHHFDRMSLILNPFFGFRPWKRHSLVLMVAGLAYVFVGLSYIIPDPTNARQEALVIALKWASMDTWGTIFVACGLVTTLSSRWPPLAETWGYTVLTGSSAGLSATYLFGVMFFDSPANNLSGFMIWGLMGFVWWAISGLVNPDHTTVVTTHGG